MRTTAIVAQWLVRITGLIQIVLGVLFWTGNQLTLRSVHILVGLILVLSLWTLAFVAGRAGVQPAFAAVAFVWGLMVAAFGLTQTQLLTGSTHWLIQVLHLLVGLTAIGQAEGLGQRIKQAAAAAV